LALWEGGQASPVVGGGAEMGGGPGVGSDARRSACGERRRGREQWGGEVGAESSGVGRGSAGSTRWHRYVAVGGGARADLALVEAGLGAV
jgi:hypothetical protein